MRIKPLKNSTVRHHITLLIAIATVSSIASVGIVSQLATRDLLKQEALAKLSHQAQIQGQTLDLQFQSLNGTIFFIETNLNHQLSQYPNLDSASIEQIKNNLLPLMIEWGHQAKPFSMWIVFNTNIVKGKHTLSFIDANSDGIYEREKEYDIAKQNQSAKEYDWWTLAIKKGEVWTNPYYWENWHRHLITYSKAIYHRGNLIACIGVDIDFSSFRDSCQKIRFYNVGHLILANNDFDIIVHPDQTSTVLSKEVIQSIQSQVKLSSHGIIANTKTKEGHLMAFSKLSNNWIMIASAPTAEIFKPLNKTRMALLGIAVLAVFIAIAIGYLLSHIIQKQIIKIIKLFEKLGKGELHHRWEDQGIKEIDTIGNHFNKFMNQLQMMVSQLNNQEKSLKAALKKANESDELKTAFLCNLSHEIRTPLNAIIGFAALLDTTELDDEERQNYIQIINRSSDKFLKLVNNILISSKLEQNQLAISSKETPIRLLIKEIQLNLQDNYDSTLKTIIFENPFTNDNQTVHVDLYLFKIVAEALVDNAWKFTHEGTIKVGGRTENGSFVFFVSDTGIGIPPLYHELIFKKFFKYKDIDDALLYEGVGIGLSIAKGIAHLHKGDIKQSSNGKEGSLFEVWIPLGGNTN